MNILSIIIIMRILLYYFRLLVYLFYSILINLSNCFIFLLTFKIKQAIEDARVVMAKEFEKKLKVEENARVIMAKEFEDKLNVEKNKAKQNIIKEFEKKLKDETNNARAVMAKEFEDKLNNDKENIKNELNNKIVGLEEKLGNYIKDLILINSELKINQIKWEIEAENQNLAMKLAFKSYKKEFNQLLNGNKVLYFRKLSSFIYEKLVQKITFKSTKTSFFNYLKPTPLKFNLMFTKKKHKGIAFNKINFIVDYLNFIKDECSLIIHLNKKGLIKKDILLNYLITMSIEHKENKDFRKNDNNKNEKEKTEEKKEEEAKSIEKKNDEKNQHNQMEKINDEKNQQNQMEKINDEKDEQSKIEMKKDEKNEQSLIENKNDENNQQNKMANKNDEQNQIEKKNGEKSQIEKINDEQKQKHMKNEEKLQIKDEIKDANNSQMKELGKKPIENKMEYSNRTKMKEEEKKPMENKIEDANKQNMKKEDMQQIENKNKKNESNQKLSKDESENINKIIIDNDQTIKDVDKEEKEEIKFNTEGIKKQNQIENKKEDKKINKLEEKGKGNNINEKKKAKEDNLIKEKKEVNKNNKEKDKVRDLKNKNKKIKEKIDNTGKNVDDKKSNNNIINNDDSQDYINIREICSYLFCTKSINDADIQELKYENEKIFDNFSFSTFDESTTNNNNEINGSDYNYNKAIIINNNNDTLNELDNEIEEKKDNNIDLIDDKYINIKKIEKFINLAPNKITNIKLITDQKQKLELLKKLKLIINDKKKKNEDLRMKLISNGDFIKITANYFFSEYKRSFSEEYYKDLKIDIKKHYKFHKEYLDIIDCECYSSLDDIQKDILTLLDPEIKIFLYGFEPHNFDKI